MHRVVFLVLAEPNNHKILLNVCDTSQSFKMLLWDALQATGTIADGETAKDTITTSRPTQQRAAIEQGLSVLAKSPRALAQLLEHPQKCLALERLVGLFMCMKIFKSSWQRAVEAYPESSTVSETSIDGSGSLQGILVVSGGCGSNDGGGEHPMDQIDLEMDDAGAIQAPRLSDGSDTTRDSLTFSESSVSDEGALAQE